MTSWTMPTLRRGADADAALRECRAALAAARHAPLGAAVEPALAALDAAGLHADTGRLLGLAALDEELLEAFCSLWATRRCGEFAYNLAAEVTGDVVRGTGDGEAAAAAADLLLYTARGYLDRISDPSGAWALTEDAIDSAWERLSVGSAAAEEVPLAAPHGPLAALIADGTDPVVALRAGVLLLRWCATHAVAAPF